MYRRCVSSGGLELIWFVASTIFVQLGSRLGWKSYRGLVAVPVASQLIGIAISFNEIHLGSIGLNVAAAQWTIESTIALAFVRFSRRHLGFAVR